MPKSVRYARSRPETVAWVKGLGAEHRYEEGLARYRAGEALITEVTDAQNALITQRQSFYQALFDYQTARARLLRAIGQ